MSVCVYDVWEYDWCEWGMRKIGPVIASVAAARELMTTR